MRITNTKTRIGTLTYASYSVLAGKLCVIFLPKAGSGAMSELVWLPPVLGPAARLRPITVTIRMVFRKSKKRHI